MCQQLCPPSGASCVPILPPHGAASVLSHRGVLSEKSGCKKRGIGGLSQASSADMNVKRDTLATTHSLFSNPRHMAHAHHNSLSSPHTRGTSSPMLSCSPFTHSSPTEGLPTRASSHIQSSPPQTAIVLPCRTSALPHRTKEPILSGRASAFSPRVPVRLPRCCLTPSERK